MSLTLGYEPQSLGIVLSRDSVFTGSLLPFTGESWPPVTSVEMRLTVDGTGEPVVWTATMDSDSISWHIDEAQVNAVIDAGLTHVRMFWIDESDSMCWTKGSIRVR